MKSQNKNTLFVVLQKKGRLFIHYLVNIQEYLYKHLIFFWQNHDKDKSYKTKLVSAMLNFHAKTEDFGLMHTVSKGILPTSIWADHEKSSGF